VLSTSNGFLSDAWIPGASLFATYEFAKVSVITYINDKLRPFWSEALDQKSEALKARVQPTESDIRFTSPAMVALTKECGVTFGQTGGSSWGMASASLGESAPPPASPTTPWYSMLLLLLCLRK
jgi:hypothetical protein